MVGFRAIRMNERKAYIQGAKPRSHDLGMPAISNKINFIKLTGHAKFIKSDQVHFSKTDPRKKKLTGQRKKFTGQPKTRLTDQRKMELKIGSLFPRLAFC